MDAKYKIENILNFLEINPKVFSERLGCQRPQIIYDILKGKTKRISEKLAIKIISEFPEISKSWLLAGEGNMLITEEQPEAIIPEEAQGQGYKLVPLYNLDVRGGFLPNTEAGKEHIAQYIAFPNAREGDICVVVSGDSMSPTFPSGSFVLLRHVEDWAEFIEYGQIYVIELRDGRRLIKEVRKAQEPDKWLCKSHNATYDDVELPKKLVTRIFLVKAMYAKFVM